METRTLQYLSWPLIKDTYSYSPDAFIPGSTPVRSVPTLFINYWGENGTAERERNIVRPFGGQPTTIKNIGKQALWYGTLRNSGLDDMDFDPGGPTGVLQPGASITVTEPVLIPPPGVKDIGQILIKP